MIGLGGLLLVVPHTYALPVTVLLVGLAKQKAKLRHLILLSRVTYWAPMEMLLLTKKEKRRDSDARVRVWKVEAGRSKVQRRNRLRVPWGTRYTFGGSWNWEWPGPSTTLATQLLELTTSVSNPHLFDIVYYFFLRSTEVNFYLHNFGVHSSSFMCWLRTLWLLDLLLVKYGYLERVLTLPSCSWVRPLSAYI